MSIPRNLLNSRRERVVLGPELGRGGEGAVFSVDGDSSAAAKIYIGGRADERREKILAMVAEGWSIKSPNVAFPIDALFDASSKFVGFTMRRIGGQKPIHSLYSPTSRKTEFPKASFRFLVRVALNIARSVANVHSTGCVIGDINHSGVLVAEDATVTLIDCDSFQVSTSHRVFNCKVGVPEFTPPELQGMRLADVSRTANHDAFGLAILLFNLLFMGRHPFAGRYGGREDMTMERAIKEFRFAYSSRVIETRMSPPPHVPTLLDLPKKLADAFEMSFGRAGAGNRRPTSSEWVALLSEAEKEIIQCGRSTAHQYFSAAKTCPWCAMEKAYPGFLAFSLPIHVDTSAPVDIGQLIAAINAVPDPGNVPTLRDMLPAISVAPRASRGLLAGLTRQYWWGLLSAVASIQCFFWPAPAPFVGMGLLGFGVWQVFKTSGVLDEPNRQKAELEKAVDNIETSWSRVSSNQSFGQIKVETSELIRRFHSLASEESQRLADLKNRVEEGQRRRFLEKFYIEKAKIKGVGASRKLTLESEGIETAADVDQYRIEAIPGFGPATASAIVAWRQSVESKFRFDPRVGVDPKDILSVKSDISRRRSECQTDLKRRLLSLREQSQRIVQARQQLKAAAEPLWHNLRTAEEQLLEAKMKLPSDSQKWMFGLAIVFAFILVSNLNNGSPRREVRSPSPSSPSVTHQNVAVANPTPVPKPIMAPNPLPPPIPTTAPKLPETPPNLSVTRNDAPEPPRPDIQPLGPPIIVRDSAVANVAAVPSPPLSPAQIDNLRNRETVHWLQKRLHDLGYLRAPSSGIFDGSTLTALRDFKSASVGRMDDDWDRGTQQALLSPSAINYRDSFIGTWTEGVVCRDRTDPNIVISSKFARSSVGGVCNFQSIAVTKAGWEILTNCTNRGEQWSAKVQFSVSGEYLLWRGRDGSTTRYARCVAQ